jgi:hypothetical protein
LSRSFDGNRIANRFIIKKLKQTISTLSQIQSGVKNDHTLQLQTTINRTETQPGITSKRTEKKSDNSMQQNSLHTNQQTLPGQSITVQITDVFCFDEEGNFYIPDSNQHSNVRKIRI